MKHLILVTSPPASGKTYVSKQLAKQLHNIVYLDKDALIPLSNRVFLAGNEEINRSSPFFEENIRNYEYIAILDIAFEALEYADLVLVNAPFTREVRDNAYIASLKDKLASLGAQLTVIWVETDIEVTRKRMIERNSPRDTWKLAHWDEYVSGRDYSTPSIPALSDCLLKFYNSSEEEYNESMERISAFLLGK
ncbi:MAG: AAA family ATPase [Eubacteriales bacterium]